MKPKLWLLLCCSLVGFSFAEYLSKIYSMRPRLSIAAMACFCYVWNIVFWLPALREHKGLAVLSTIWSMAYTVVSVLIGVLIFQEQFTPKQMVGIVLAFVTIWLLS